MTVKLSTVGRELFDHLTAQTFYVVDTEFCTHNDQHHLISIAVVAVIGGSRTRASNDLYYVVNPGVPIDDQSQQKHGFTNAKVAKKPEFAAIAPLLLARMSDDNAVFVCHNPIDAHVLLKEFQRLSDRMTAGDPAVTVTLDDLPTMPVIDTQRLAACGLYPGIASGTKLSLAKMCTAMDVKGPKQAHNALDDARATADALRELLAYAAEKSLFWTFDALLQVAGAGTTHAPKGPSHIKPRNDYAASLPPEHLTLHIYPLVEPVQADSEEAERWLQMAAECAELRCPFLRDEATVAAQSNGAVLLDSLMDDLPLLTEPGQAGTLLGAVHVLLTAPSSPGAPPTLTSGNALKWWSTARRHVLGSPPCDRTQPETCCPSCREGLACPRDVLHLPVAETATLGPTGVLSNQRAREVLEPSQKKSPLNTWRRHHPEVLAYAIWRIARFLADEGYDERAFSAIELGTEMNLHTVEPRLTEVACDRLVELGDAPRAFAVARAVLAQRTTDTAYDDLASWVQFTENELYSQQPPPRRAIREPRRARPPGHANPRLYS